jgi:hypothetical protein
MAAADVTEMIGRRLARRYFLMLSHEGRIEFQTEAALAVLLTIAAEMGRAGLVPTQAQTEATDRL